MRKLRYSGLFSEDERTCLHEGGRAGQVAKVVTSLCALMSGTLIFATSASINAQNALIGSLRHWLTLIFIVILRGNQLTVVMWSGFMSLEKTILAIFFAPTLTTRTASTTTRMM